eukprot:NODE_266_length_1772_cov_112.378116_g238_i0.p1 GENE.NODE_266_length_1772_cov_112.378116_g238_i0~~NODE_266_length_1772_cov_112.378116_g238_i0.p1  ORF type:complete len:298 (+),score=57.04 NODE_266_length_1772_cov_112.378116_g238_i0:138-1031(+)
MPPVSAIKCMEGLYEDEYDDEDYYEEENHDYEDEEHEDYDWAVEKIVDRKRMNGVVHYKVQWKGSTDKTWEPETRLDCVKLIHKFNLDRQVPLERPNDNLYKQMTTPKPKKVKKPKVQPVYNPYYVPYVSAHTPATDPGKPRGDRSASVVVNGLRVHYTPTPKAREFKNPGTIGSTTRVLLHGTKWTFASNIVGNGFRLPKTRSGHGIGAVRPHMFGKGVYLTSSMCKAGHFGDTVLVCEVTVGIYKTCMEADYDITLDTLRSAGSDSVYAPPGAGGNVYDEWVIFDPAQIKVLGYV